MGLVHTGPIVSSELSSTAMIKRAVSRELDVSAAEFTALFYTSTAIIVTAVSVYTTEVTTAAAQTLDVGIDGTQNSIVTAGVIASLATDSVTPMTLTTPGATPVAAGHAVTAHILNNAGTGTIIICMEYTEAD